MVICMNKPALKYIYGPVYSWRIGHSLGIDPLSDGAKICNYDCIYCQLGRSSELETQRKVFVPTATILDEIRHVTAQPIDYLTFSGRGEPTLALNLGEMIRGLRDFRSEKIAVITNASLIDKPDVQADLFNADLVIAKLDAVTPKTFGKVDLPDHSIKLVNIFEGLRSFRKKFKGKLCLQIMFLKENIKEVAIIAEVVKYINPYEVELNTPLRPSGANPLTENVLVPLKDYFNDLSVKVVFEEERRTIEPMNVRETIKRHGNYLKSVT